jgi:hypothetical protein
VFSAVTVYVKSIGAFVRVVVFIRRGILAMGAHAAEVPVVLLLLLLLLG